ncbi:MAG: serine/threonine-protein kinase [Cyanobacteria bacterium P01_D01_bin.6]
MLNKHRSAKYQLLGLVGRGQFGQVYCAIHRKTGQLVALKNLNRDRFPTHSFLRELRFLLSLDHPHIASCLALDQSSNSRQLVLEYCEGGTLRDVIEQDTHLTLAEILTLIVEILSALEHAHASRLIHCDIKPENILLTLSPDGWHAKVSDFGIARVSQEMKRERRGATGSPAYMAPERFYFQFSTASDLYAVGIMLYELLLGDRPFSGNYQQLMVSHLNHPVAVPGDLPAGIQAILKKATEKLTPRRFRSATEMKAAIIQVRQALTAGDLRERFPQGLAPQSTDACESPPSLALSTPCSALALTHLQPQAPQLIAASQQDLYGWPLNYHQTVEPNTTPAKWRFDTSITQLSPTPSGVIVVTGQRLSLLTAGGILPLAQFDCPIKVLPGSQRWAFVQALEPPMRVWAIDTQRQIGPTPRALPAPVASQESGIQAMALDDRHYAIASRQDQQTHLYVLTRKGHWLGKLSLQVSIHQLFASQKSAYAIAVAGTQKRDFLVIRFSPYRIMRCRLDITPTWLGELATGYVAISQKGEMRLVNFAGQLIGQVNNLPIPTAVCFQPPHQVWLASATPEGTHRLHQVDLQALNLDILF